MKPSGEQSLSNRSIVSQKGVKLRPRVLLFEDRIIDHSANIQDMLNLAQDKYPNDKYPHGTVRIKKVFQGTPREKLLEQ